MNADELRALQAPLKQRYRDEPETAIVTSRAEATLDREDIVCVVADGRNPLRAGLHPAGGGDGSAACSADMLLQALVACAGVTLRAVATAMSIPLRGGRIVAEGKWDARGTLGVDKAAPIGLTDISLRFTLDTDAEAAKLERLIATTERYCVIFQTLRAPPRMTVSHQVGSV